MAQEQERGRRVRLGLGGQVAPAYPGADEYQLGPFFEFSLARIGRTFAFEAPDDSPSINLLGREGIGFGPAGNLQASRNNSEVGAPIGKVSTTVELGAFVQYMFGEQFRVRAEGRKGVNGHDGFVGEVSADFVRRDGDKFVFSIGPRASLTDAQYQRAYFGVDGAQAAATGLPLYRPSGGLQSVGASTGLNYQFSDRWGMFGYARYDRLVGDAADSPVVRGFGSRNQYSAGLGLTYTFTVRFKRRGE